MDGMASNPAVTGAFTTGASAAGITDSRASRQWAMRPDDQRFLTLADLRAAIAARTVVAQTLDVAPSAIEVLAHEDDDDLLWVAMGGAEMSMTPTHWSFGQLCKVAGVPASYLRRPDMPALLSAVNLQFGLSSAVDVPVRAYFGEDKMDLRAVTSTTYGRILDLGLVDQVIDLAGDGSRWKVPGMMKGLTHNPFVDVTKQNTTLYASDRDVFIFMTDDLHPTEIGKLPNGDPDLVFPGFFAWNSEVGNTTMGLATFLLRGVCCNRNVWGGQDLRELTIRHTRAAPEKFVAEVKPKLIAFTEQSSAQIVAGVNAARGVAVGKSDTDVTEWLVNKAGTTQKEASTVLATVLKEEEHTARSLWDVVQGLSAMARSVTYQDERVGLERKAGALLAKALG